MTDPSACPGMIQAGSCTDLAPIAQLDDVFVLDAEPLCQGRAQERGIVPRELRERLGQLLEPAVIGPPAVPDRRVGPEDDLEAFRYRPPPALPAWSTSLTLGETGLGLLAVPAIKPGLEGRCARPTRNRRAASGAASSRE